MCDIGIQSATTPNVDAERIQLKSKGYIQIAKTDSRFPLGERGQRPVRFFLNNDADIVQLKTEKIPGVLVRGQSAVCTFDAGTIVCEIIEEPNALDATILKRTTCLLDIPGKERYQGSKLFKMRYGYQAETARFLFRRAYAVCGEIPRSGKILMLLIVAELAAAKKVVVVLNALGKPVYALDVAKWLNEEAVTLWGRGGSEVRRFCAACRGSGMIVDEDGDERRERCAKCKGKGETIFVAHQLEVVTEGRVYFMDTGKLKKDGTPRTQRRVARYTPLPIRVQCPKHKDVTGKAGDICSKCQAVVFDVIDKARFILVNYDIISPHHESELDGREIVRHDLPGWGAVLARYKFDMAVISESHYVRGTKQTLERENKVRAEYVEELVRSIERVYAETGTFIYGFPRDAYMQLNIISKGLWS